MTITTLAPAPTATEAVPSTTDRADLEELRRSVRSLGESLAELPLTNPRWHALGASVSTVADLLRRSTGNPVATVYAELVPVARLRDLAVAGRLLLGRDAKIVDPEAARDARDSCARILRELPWLMTDDRRESCRTRTTSRSLAAHPHGSS